MINISKEYTATVNNTLTYYFTLDTAFGINVMTTRKAVKIKVATPELNTTAIYYIGGVDNNGSTLYSLFAAVSGGSEIDLTSKAGFVILSYLEGEIKTPSGFDVTISDIVDLQVNLSGTTNADVIAAGKRTLNLSYSVLTAVELAALITQLKASFFMYVYYPDPQDNAYRLGTFRCSDINIPMYQNSTAKKLYNDVKFQLVER